MVVRVQVDEGVQMEDMVHHLFQVNFMAKGHE